MVAQSWIQHSVDCGFVKHDGPGRRVTVTRVADVYAPARPPCSAAPQPQRIAVSDRIGILETTTFSHFDWVLGFEVESGHVTSLFENCTRAIRTSLSTPTGPLIFAANNSERFRTLHPLSTIEKYRK